MHKLRENAEKELKAIEEKGLTSSNLDNAYKLVEIMKGVDKIEMSKATAMEAAARVHTTASVRQPLFVMFFFTAPSYEPPRVMPPKPS